MNRLKRNILYIAFFTCVACAAGCTNVRESFRGHVPTSTPTPTPTRSVNLWVTATPVNHATATPTMTLEEALKKAEDELREKYRQTPTPTQKYAIPATPTPYVKPVATPTLRPGVSPTPSPTPITLPNGDPDPNAGGATATATPTTAGADTTKSPTKAPTKTPTKSPTKAPTATPTKSAKPSGKPTAEYLLNLLYETYPEYMATMSVMIDLRETNDDGDVKNMYYTEYINSENYKDTVHSSKDVWVNTGDSESFTNTETYYVIGSSDVTTYTRVTPPDDSNWRKSKVLKDKVKQGITVVERSGNIGLLNPRIITDDPDAGYEIEMDFAMDFSSILSTLTNGAYNKRFNKTFKAKALFDHETLTPILLVAEANELHVSNTLELHYCQIRVDNILENTFDFPDLEDIKKIAK